MLLTPGLLIYAVLMVIAAFCGYSALRSPAPDDGPLADHYEFEPRLYAARVVLVTLIFAGVITRACHKVGYLAADPYAAIQIGGRLALAASLVAFIGLLACAEIKRRRAARTPQST